MIDLTPFEFYIVRYVPNAITGEFVNIGVVLTAVGDEGVQKLGARFTRDWSRVRALDADADVSLLEVFGVETRNRLEQSTSAAFPRPTIIERMLDSFSNAIQLTAGQRTLGASFDAELERLMKMYVDVAIPET